MSLRPRHGDDAAEMVWRSHADRPVRVPDPLMRPTDSGADSGSSTAAECCGGDCVEKKYAHIDSGGDFMICPKYYFIHAILGGVVKLYHVTDNILESDTVEYECEDGADNYFWRLTVNYEVRESTLELVLGTGTDDGSGGTEDTPPGNCDIVAPIYKNRWEFDPICGTSFQLTNRMDLPDEVASVISCSMCIIPLEETVVVECGPDTYTYTDTLYARITGITFGTESGHTWTSDLDEALEKVLEWGPNPLFGTYVNHETAEDGCATTVPASENVWWAELPDFEVDTASGAVSFSGAIIAVDPACRPFQVRIDGTSGSYTLATGVPSQGTGTFSPGSRGVCGVDPDYSDIEINTASYVSHLLFGSTYYYGMRMLWEIKE